MTRQARHPALIAPPKALQAPILNSSVPRDAHLRAKSAMKIFHAVTLPSHSAPTKTQCIVEDVKSALKPTLSHDETRAAVSKTGCRKRIVINPLSRHRHPKTMSGRSTHRRNLTSGFEAIATPTHPLTHSLLLPRARRAS